MKKRLTFKPLENLKIDFLEVMSQFNTETVITEVEYAGTFSRTPDNHYHKLLSGNKIYYIYEVDYISSLKDGTDEEDSWSKYKIDESQKISSRL